MTNQPTAPIYRAHIDGLRAIMVSASWYFAMTTDYFNTEAHTNTLLHTWSLGVEEQFYLFFPLILADLFHNYRLTVAILSLIFIASLATRWLTALYSSAAGTFFFAHLRLWELFAGVGASNYAPVTQRLLANNHQHVPWAHFSRVYVALGYSLATKTCALLAAR